MVHLVKARGFLGAARAALDAGRHNAAASSAVLAGINAKDAQCFAGAEPGNALDRLLGLEDRARYDRRSLGASDAQAAVRRAATLVEAAERALTE